MQFDALIHQGEAIAKRLSQLADDYEAGRKDFGNPSLWVHQDEYFGWFDACSQKIEEVFIGESLQLQEWKKIIASVNLASEHGNPYIKYLAVCRNAIGKLHGFNSISLPKPVIAFREIFNSLNFLKARLGANGMCAILIALSSLALIWHKTDLILALIK